MRHPVQLVELDGRTLEGGGQLLRIAICLSALTGTTVKITDIRGNRSGGGGLKAQHLACVKWLAHACNAEVEGASIKSKTLVFKPGHIQGDLSPAYTKTRLASGEQVFEARLDIGTAGSTGLALQAILPFILFSSFPADTDIPVRLTLSGGTNVSGSPSYEYITQVLLPTLRSLGFGDLKAGLGKRGWSHGGSSIGNFTLEIPHRKHRALPAFTLAPSDAIAEASGASKPDRIQATLIAPSSCHEHFRSVLLPAVQRHFGDAWPPSSDEKLSTVCEDSKNDKRIYLILVATVPTTSPSVPAADTPQSYKLGRDWLYDRRISRPERAVSEMVERVAKELADEWRSGSYVDVHMRDQLVIFQALAEGRSVVCAGRDAEDGEQLREPDLHARTAEWVARRMLGVRFDAEGGCEGTRWAREMSRLDNTEGLTERLGSLDVG